MYKNLPNALTILRLVLAGVFFVTLNQFRYIREHESNWILWTAMGIFIVAMLTDVADGYLARRWKVESTFGRIMDPVVDKVMILGALIYLAGPRFIDPDVVTNEDHLLFNMVPGNMVSGFYPWMVAVVLVRELLVTAVRSELETSGTKFGAKLHGKLKALIQSMVIPFILGIVALDPNLEGHGWMVYVRNVLVYTMVLVTVLSGLPYLMHAAKVLKEK